MYDIVRNDQWEAAMQGWKPKVFAGGFGVAALLAVLLVAYSAAVTGWLYSQAMPTAYFSHFKTIQPALLKPASHDRWSCARRTVSPLSIRSMTRTPLR
jgi:hypothetical protein